MMRAFVAIVVMVQLTACSLTMTAAKTPAKVDVDPDCSDSAIPPAVDTTLAVIAGIAFTPSVIYAVQPLCGFSSQNSNCIAIRQTALISGLASLAFVGGAVRGYGVKHECRAAYANHAAWAASQPATEVRVAGPAAPRAPAPASSGSSNIYGALLVVGILGTIVGAVAAGVSISKGFHL